MSSPAMPHFTIVCDIPSPTFGNSFAYANAVKTQLLGVSEDTLARSGAVSEETAIQMAAGIRELYAAEACLVTP